MRSGGEYSTRNSAALMVLTAALCALLAGCDVPPEFATETPRPTVRSIAPSPTVLPAIPTAGNPDSPNENILSYTPAIVPTAIGVDATITPTPGPTLAVIDTRFLAADGLTLYADYYGAAIRPAPTVLLLHMLGSSKAAWGAFAGQLREAGFNVLALDLRGHGLTGGTQDWAKAQQDILTVLPQVAAQADARPDSIMVIGASIGANLAINACAAWGNCRAVVLLSPALDYRGVLTEAAVQQYGPRPLLLAASRGDRPGGEDSVRLNGVATGDRRVILNDGTAHGTDMLTAYPDLAGQIILWLQAH